MFDQALKNFTQQKLTMNLKDKTIVFISTGCFIGKIPFAPGTAGSLIGLPICFALSKIDLAVAVIITLIFIIFSIWIAHEAERILNKKDPGCIVIDEIAGIIVIFIGLPFNLISATVGFAVFRVLDIVKPYPIRIIEKKISGGMGIVLDDVAAGIIGNLLLRILLTIM